MTPDERVDDLTALLTNQIPRRDYYVTPRDVVCEPCGAGNHRGCVRPCTCTTRPEKDTP